MLFFINVLSGTAYPAGHVSLQNPKVGDEFYADIPLRTQTPDQPPVRRKLLINGINHAQSRITATIVGT